MCVAISAYIVHPRTGKTSELVNLYPFTKEAIDQISPDIKCGMYRIGRCDGDEFRVKYFGRSDINDNGLAQRIARHLPGNDNEICYDDSYLFTYEPVENSIDAFNLECGQYHTYFDLERNKITGNGVEIDNTDHPQIPEGNINDVHCLFPGCNVGR